jgi:DNA adenine methylase
MKSKKRYNYLNKGGYWMIMSSKSFAKIPHPIPYQGSKRKLCSTIASFVGRNIHTLYEPFAGSAAFTLYAAHNNLAKRFVIGDVLEPLIELWRLIVSAPELVSDSYERIWKGQIGVHPDYYSQIRDKYNQTGDPVMLLYLIARCVKNAVRFSNSGKFTQSADKRRLGMKPDKMKQAVRGVSVLLAGRVQFIAGDFQDCLLNAESGDFVYMDPPYQGITYGRDKRYYQQLEPQRLFDALKILNQRRIPFILSYDGKQGDKEYGMVLPDELCTQRVLINAGRSSQATLNGVNAITLEALYISQHLTKYNHRQVGIEKSEQMNLGI